MKRTVKSLQGYSIGATDGEIGTVKEVYFDDSSWTIRYLVVETGTWLSGRKVLISPQAISSPLKDDEILPVNLTMDQVKHSPDIDTDKPVSRQHEMELYNYYPWTSYWGGGMWAGGLGTTGMMLPHVEPFEAAIRQGEANESHGEEGDPHLQSSSKVKSYTIHAQDGDVGEVEDFIIDDNTWKIRFLVVDTGNWLPGKKVLISPQWIEHIEWETSRVTVNVGIDKIKNAPEYDQDKPVSDDYEQGLYGHYDAKFS
jgi:uncharacterized protein YrrD